MDIIEIQRQYRDDVNIAVKLDLIPCDIAQKIFEWLVDDYRIRSFRLKLASNEIRSLRDTIYAMRHPATAPREKIRFLRGYFASLGAASI